MLPPSLIEFPPPVLLRLPCFDKALDFGRGVMTTRCTDDGRSGAGGISMASSSNSYGCEGGEGGIGGCC
jgi:hypothetical protein